MAAVPMDITSTIPARTLLRPTRSPRLPRKNAPNGLATKATAKVAKVASSAVCGLSLEKNTFARIGADAPYRTKSYHSTKLPIAPAMTALRETASSGRWTAAGLFSTSGGAEGCDIAIPFQAPGGGDPAERVGAGLRSAGEVLVTVDGDEPELRAVP